MELKDRAPNVSIISIYIKKLSIYSDVCTFPLMPFFKKKSALE